MQWKDVFNKFLHRKISVRTIPLSYVTRVTALTTRQAYFHKDDLLHGERILILLRKSLLLKLHTCTPSIVRTMQLCTTALKKQSGALNMP
eukprot:14151702-Ditylum_brightwellii.AAC.2